jgi:hypothetical protein
MSKIKTKIESLLDVLQDAMESNLHLEQPERVDEMCSALSIYWEQLDDEGKDYVHGARHAIEEKIEWKI